MQILQDRLADLTEVKVDPGMVPKGSSLLPVFPGLVTIRAWSLCVLYTANSEGCSSTQP